MTPAKLAEIERKGLAHGDFDDLIAAARFGIELRGLAAAAVVVGLSPIKLSVARSNLRAFLDAHPEDR